MEKIEIEDGDPLGVPIPEVPPEVSPAPPPRGPQPDPVTTAVRLVVGTASLGLTAFRSRLRAWGQEQPP